METKRRRVLAYDGAGKFLVLEEHIPEPKPGEVLVEVRASLVSPGTEMTGVVARRQDPDPSLPPRKFGYANAGLVLEVGEGCEGIRPGARVACMGSGYAFHASHALVPENLTVPIPENVSFEEASFCHLASTALQAVRRGEVQLGHNVVVVGLGIIGQVAAQLCGLSGAQVMGVDLLSFRVKLATDLGVALAVNASEEDPVERAVVFTGGWGMDVAIVAFGGEADEAIE